MPATPAASPICRRGWWAVRRVARAGAAAGEAAVAP